jgi:flavin reductase (DIM6/NTAB) family NADH-FMN oxidoreductase RutF
MTGVTDKFHRILAPRLVVTLGTVSVPHRKQLELIWKLGQKYSGYSSGKDKIEEFKDRLDLDFSEHGPVVKDALGWIEYEIVERPADAGADHYLVIGKCSKAKVNPIYYDLEISPKGNLKPFMQWERNHFAEASDIFTIDYFNDPGF